MILLLHEKIIYRGRPGSRSTQAIPYLCCCHRVPEGSCTPQCCQKPQIACAHRLLTAAYSACPQRVFCLLEQNKEMLTIFQEGCESQDSSVSHATQTVTSLRWHISEAASIFKWLAWKTLTASDFTCLLENNLANFGKTKQHTKVVCLYIKSLSAS